MLLVVVVPPGETVIVYATIGSPLSPGVPSTRGVGAAHVSPAEVSPLVATTPMGANGAPAGVTVFEAGDGGPVRMIRVVEATVKLTGVPLRNEPAGQV